MRWPVGIVLDRASDDEPWEEEREVYVGRDWDFHHERRFRWLF